MTFTPRDDPVELRCTSVGTALPGTEIALVDPTTLQPDERGELWVRGEQVMLGYYGKPQASAEAVTSQGWLRTGDLAELDSSRRYRIVGRIKEMILRGGENVYPAEVEEAIRMHPSVGTVAVFGIPDPRLGEQVACAIIRKPGASLDPDLLKSFLRERIAKTKVPETIAFVDELPMTASGKVQRFLLSQRFGRGLEVPAFRGKLGMPLIGERMRTRTALCWFLLVAAFAPTSPGQDPARPSARQGSGAAGVGSGEGINEKGLNRRTGRRKGALSPAALRSRPLDLIIRGAAIPPVADPSQPKRVTIPAERPETPDTEIIRPNPLSFRILTEPPEPEEEEGAWEGKGKGKGKEKAEREPRRPDFLARTPTPDRALNPYLRADVRAFYGIEPRGSFYLKTAPELTIAPSARRPRAATGAYSDFNSYQSGRKNR